MSLMKRTILLGAASFSLLLVALAYPVWAEAISPSQEQEFVDAREALEAARKTAGEKLAPAYIKQAEDFLKIAGTARSIPDAAGFSRAARLARAYAELAKATAELTVDTEMLATTQDSLQKTKVEIEALKR